MFNEKTLVEDYIIEQLQQEGWRFIPADALETPLILNKPRPPLK